MLPLWGAGEGSGDGIGQPPHPSSGQGEQEGSGSMRKGTVSLLLWINSLCINNSAQLKHCEKVGMAHLEFFKKSNIKTTGHPNVDGVEPARTTDCF